MCAQRNPADFPPDRTRIRIGRFDRVVINGQPFTLVMNTEDGYQFQHDDGSGRTKPMSLEELRTLDRLKRIDYQHNLYHPERARLAKEASGPNLSELSDREAAFLSIRSAFTDAVEELRKEGLVKITDASINENMDTIAGRAQMMMGDHGVRRRDGRIKALDDNWRPKPGTLRKWATARRKYGLDELVPGFAKRGGKGTPLHPEVSRIMWKEIQRYLTYQGPDKKDIWEGVCLRVNKVNEQRRKEGLTELRAPCQRTVSNNINKLDAFQVAAARGSEEMARKSFRPTTTGVQYTRPLERVEIDEHELDLWTIIDPDDWADILSEEDITRLGLRKGKGRLWITLAICCTTKAIVGLTITPSPTSRAALQTLEMILTDKGRYSDRAGATGSWNMYGLPEKVVTDCGAGFRSEAFRHARIELGIVVERVKAGVPEMRGVGERIFRTVNQKLIKRLTGSTFHDKMTSDAPKDRPRGEDRAALTLEDLAFSIVRWVVDIYHMEGTEGLFGESPRDCWDRLTTLYGVNGSPDERRTRMIFGTRLTRTLDKTGITVLGVRYHSPDLAANMNREGQRKVDVRWHPSNIGVIAVRYNNAWREVKAVADGFDGAAAENWLTAARHVRAGRKTVREIDIRTALDAMEEIQKRSDDATLAAGIALNRWSPERLAYAESRVMAGVKFREAATPTVDQNPGRPGTPIEEPVDPPRPPEEAVRSEHAELPASEKPKRKPKSEPKAEKPKRPPIRGSGGRPVIVEED